MSYDVVIVGNGILGTSLAYLLSKQQPDLKIALVGQSTFPGSASYAAGAMINVFAEADRNTFHDDHNEYRFSLANRARQMWSAFEDQVYNDTGKSFLDKRGTCVIKTKTDQYNFDCIVKALKKFDIKHTFSDESIQKLDLNDDYVVIPDEFHLDPRYLLNLLTRRLKITHNVSLYDSLVLSLNVNKTITIVDRVTNFTNVIQGQKLVLCAGAETDWMMDDLGIQHQSLFYGTGIGMLFDSAIQPSMVMRTPVRGATCGIVLIPGTNLYIGSNTKVSRNPYSNATNWNVMTHIIKQVTNHIDPQYENQIKWKDMVVGHRPVTEDSFPLVGETSIKDVFVLTGTRRDGLTMMPLYVEDMINRLSGKSPLIDERFHPEREPIRWLTADEGVEQMDIALRQYYEEHDMPSTDSNKEAKLWYETRNLAYGVLPELREVL